MFRSYRFEVYFKLYCTHFRAGNYLNCTVHTSELEIRENETEFKISFIQIPSMLSEVCALGQVIAHQWVIFNKFSKAIKVET